MGGAADGAGASEALEPGEEGKVRGKLNYSLYGTRDAAVNWSEEYTERLVACGFSPGIATPCVFDHAERKLRA